jgi:hypothetical protein
MTKCEECKSWQFVGNYGPLSDGEEIGECRRRSPAPASGQQHQLMQMLRVVALSAAKASGLDTTHQPRMDDAAIPVLSAIYHDLNQPAGWPVTTADAWCGEFEKRAEATGHS